MLPTPPMPALNREFYTREELAELLRVSLRTVDEWVAEQRIAHFRKGRNVRFAREAVAEFVLNATVLARNGQPAGLVLSQAQANLLRSLLEPVVRSILEQQSIVVKTA